MRVRIGLAHALKFKNSLVLTIMIDWRGQEILQSTRRENTLLPSISMENFHSAQEPSANSQMLCSSMMLDMLEMQLTARL
jgi:hypothetical protein